MSVRARRAYLAKGERREQLLDAALAAFVRGGYHGTHVKHIVEEAGVARGTFYLHFESKHEVFTALVDRTLAIILEAAPERDAAAFRSLEDARHALTGSYLQVLQTLRRHRRLCRLLLEEAVGIDKGFRARLEEHYAAWRRMIAGTLRRMVESGVVRADVDLELAAEAVVGMVDRVTRRYVLPDAEPDLRRLAAAVADMELRGVGAVR